MVSNALRSLFEREAFAEKFYPSALELQADDTSSEIVADHLINELARIGCRIVLVEGRPVIRGNRVAISSDLLARVKKNREAIVESLEVLLSDDQTSYRQAGIRLDKETGKMHIFGDPSSEWLRAQGWKWDRRRHRFMAPYPFDREDPHPSCMIGGGPKLPAGFPEVIYEPEHREGRAA